MHRVLHNLHTEVTTIAVALDLLFFFHSFLLITLLLSFLLLRFNSHSNGINTPLTMCMLDEAFFHFFFISFQFNSFYCRCCCGERTRDVVVCMYSRSISPQNWALVVLSTTLDCITHRHSLSAVCLMCIKVMCAICPTFIAANESTNCNSILSTENELSRHQNDRSLFIPPVSLGFCCVRSFQTAHYLFSAERNGGKTIMTSKAKWNKFNRAADTHTHTVCGCCYESVWLCHVTRE